MLKINNIRKRFNKLKNKKIPPQQLEEIRGEFVEESTINITYLTQVMLLEEFLEQEIGQKFTFVFEVGEIEEISSEPRQLLTFSRCFSFK